MEESEETALSGAGPDDGGGAVVFPGVPLKVLMVEDSEIDALLLARTLRGAGYLVRHGRVDTREGLEAALRDETWDLVLADENATRFTAGEALERVVAAGRDFPVLPVPAARPADLLPAVERELREAENRRGRALAEESLRRTWQWHGLILDRLPLVLYTATRTETLWVSDNAARVTGFGAVEFLGKGRLWAARLHPEDRERVLEEVDLVEEEGVVTSEYRWLARDGRWLHVLDHAVAARESPVGRTRRIHGILLDVTERRQLEEQFRQAQKMEALGQLAGGVAHDYNNMLTVIQGYGELLRNSLNGDARMRGYVEEILSAADRSAALSRQLLAFSRRHRLQPEVLDLNGLVADGTRMLAPLLTEAVRLSTDLDPSLRAVRADPGALEQVLMNLAVNARDAMEGTGELRFATANLGPGDPRLPARALGEEWVMLSVADTGCGIAPSLLPRIFDPFFTTKEQGRGTGLGLAMVRGIMDRSGGHVTVESAPGQGTTVRLLLPRHAEPEENEPVPLS